MLKLWVELQVGVVKGEWVPTLNLHSLLSNINTQLKTVETLQSTQV